MRNWGRFIYQPVLPMGKGGTRLTGSKEHIALSREAAREGMVLLKNEHDVLPVPAGKKVALFGSYDWGDGQWMRDWQQRTEAAGAKLVAAEGLIVHLTPEAADLEQCAALGKSLAE